MKSVMVHDFSRLPKTESQRSSFDRSHGLKTAFDSGWLVPVELQEVLPGDEVDFDATFFGRLAPAVTPVMDNVYLDFHAFFCPSRLLWNNFTKMMGERINPKDSIDYLVPQIEAGEKGFAVGSLADYFGIPTGVPGLKVNALPFRMYAKVWDDWYRADEIQDSIIQKHSDLDDGNGTIEWNKMLKRGKRLDYFTSALPYPQLGDAVNIPLGTTAPVIFGQDMGGASYELTYGSSGASAIGHRAGVKHSGNLAQVCAATASGNASDLKSAGNYAAATLEVDLSSATAATINSLRTAFQLQRLYEKQARCGNRFQEILAGQFNTICPDARLQRSEYLGGTSSQIGFVPIAQTSSGADTPQGNLVANGKVAANLKFHKSFTENGYILILANIRCDLNYQSGLDRMWSRRGRYDFFWPVLQNLGEQAVLNKEIYAQGPGVVGEDGKPVDDGVFGYQERYAEYRYNPSKITGKLRSKADQSLDVWHLAQDFDQLPTLSPEFIEDNPPLKRILAVQDEPELILDAYLGQKWTRAMGLYAIPGLIDHL